MNEDQLARRRQAVQSVAADLVKQSGGKLTQDQAVRRVAAANERGDRMRENSNR